jgi:alcohol dehydrogenase
MRALVYDAHLKLIADLDPPDPSPDEALIRILLAGICNTDLEITRGYMGGPSALEASASGHGVLGHEFVGRVEGAPNAAWIGQRVVGEINCACGTCPTCLRGDAPHCSHRTTLGIDRRDGVLADYCVLPLRNLIRVPDAVSDRQAVFCEPLAAALEITDRLHIRPTERAIVVGDGKLGLLVAQVLRLTGCSLLVVGHHRRNLAIVAGQGVEVCLERDLDGETAYWGATADVVVDCTGHPGGFALARKLVRPRGRLVLKSTFHVGASHPADTNHPREDPIDLTMVVVDEVSLIGSRCGPFEPALRLLERGLVDVDSLVEAEMPLEEGLAAFERAATRGALKVLVRP